MGRYRRRVSYKPSGEPVWPDERSRQQWEAAQALVATGDLVGLSVEEARSRVEQAGLPFRHLELDSSVPYMLSADLRPGRVTATARSGVVIKVEVTN